MALVITLRPVVAVEKHCGQKSHLNACYWDWGWGDLENIANKIIPRKNVFSILEAIYKHSAFSFVFNLMEWAYQMGVGSWSLFIVNNLSLARKIQQSLIGNLNSVSWTLEGQGKSEVRSKMDVDNQV